MPSSDPSSKQNTDPEIKQTSPDEQIDEKTIVKGLRRWTLLRERRQLHFLRAALVGLLAGAFGVLFQGGLFYVENLRVELLGSMKISLPWGWIFIPIIGAGIGALAGWITSRYAPEAAGSGIPHVKAVLLQVRTLNWRRVLPVKFIGGILSIGAGFSLGREGPTVQMGAAAGRMVSSILKVPRRSRSQLIAAGAGAGLAAAFNAPLAGFIFVIEELQREMSPVTYGTALIAAVVGDIVTRTFTGQLPSFHITGYPTPPLNAIPMFAVLGIVCGLMGILFNKGLMASLKTAHKIKNAPAWKRAAVVGAIIGLAAWWMPTALGGGHTIAETLLRGHASLLFSGDQTWLAIVGFLFVLLIVKFILTLISYASGVPGGIFAPMLVLGALCGSIVGYIGVYSFPSINTTPAVFAVIGMAAAFSAIVRAPLTGIVLILEMTANHNLLFALLVASLIAYLIAETFQNKPIYEDLLDYDLSRHGEKGQVTSDPEILDMVVESNSQMDGSLVSQLGLPTGCLLVTIRRGGQEIVPSGDTALQPGDHLTVIVSGQTPEVCALIQRRGVSE